MALQDNKPVKYITEFKNKHRSYDNIYGVKT